MDDASPEQINSEGKRPEFQKRRIPRPLFYSVIVFVGFFLLYQVITFPPLASYVIRSLVSSSMNAQLSMDLKRFGLFGILYAENVSLETNDGDPLFRAEEIRFRYSLLKMMIGIIGVEELTLRNPQLYMTKTEQGWNTDVLFGAGGETQKEEVEASGPISLPASVRLYLNLFIKNLQIYYKNDFENPGQSFRLTGVDLDFRFRTHAFSEIPFSPDLVNVIDTLSVSVNGSGNPVVMEFSGNNHIKGPGILKLELHKSEGSVFRLSSKLDLDTGKILVLNGNNIALPLNFYAGYDLVYTPSGDRLDIKRFYIKHHDDPLLDFRAVVEGLQGNGKGRMDIEFKPTTIRLDRLAGTLHGFMPSMRNAMDMTGTVQIREMSLRGPFQDVNFGADIRGDRIRVHSYKQIHRVDDLRIRLRGNGYISTFFENREHQNETSENKKGAMGIFRRLDLEDVRFAYNGGKFRIKGGSDPNGAIRASLSLFDFSLDQYSAPNFTGTLYSDFNLVIPRDSFEILYDGEFRLRNSRYAMFRSRSTPHDYLIRIKGNLGFTDKGMIIRFDRGDLRGKNEAGEETFNAIADANIRIGKEQIYDFQFHKFDLAYPRMHSTFPGMLQHMMSPYKIYLSKGIRGTGRFVYGLGNGSVTMETDMVLQVPYLNVTDLRYVSRMTFDSNRSDFQKIRITGFRDALNAEIRGEMVREDADHPYKTYMNVALNMHRPELLPVHQNVSMKGKLDLSMKLTPEEASGHINGDHLDVVYHLGDCSDVYSESCSRWDVYDLNIRFPFHHDFTLKKYKVLSDSPMVRSSTYGMGGKSNFSIRSVSSNRNPSGRKRNSPFYLVGSPSDREDGFSANLEYNNNIVIMDNLVLRIHKELQEGRWYPSGTVHGNNLYYNTADMTSAHQEYGASLRIKNFDLAPYMPGATPSYRGVFSADMELSGNDMRDPLNNMNARLEFHQLSEDFAGFLTRVLVPAPTVAWAANQTLSIPFIRIQLKSGLIYSTITVKQKGFISKLISPSGEEIKQERMPFARFMQRTREEIDTMEKGDIKK